MKSILFIYLSQCSCAVVKLLSSESFLLNKNYIMLHEDNDSKITLAQAKTPYQINPSKVIKGSKLTVRELLQKQKLKSIGTSPKTKIKHKFNKTKAEIIQPKVTQFYQKYRGLQTIDDQQSMLKFISYQRQKYSQESARGIKLFNSQKRSNTLEEDSFSTHPIAFSSKNTKSGLSNRRNHSAQQNPNHQTISYDHPFNTDPKHSFFQSGNLGVRMNEYLNLVLSKRQQLNTNQREEEMREEAELFQLKNDLISHVRTVNKNVKMKTTGFYRKMKKNKKDRVQSANPNNGNFQENSLIRSLIKQTSRLTAERSPLQTQRIYLKSLSNPIRQSHRHTSKSFYSKASLENNSAKEARQAICMIYIK